jgi:hypothetical protein
LPQAIPAIHRRKKRTEEWKSGVAASAMFPRFRASA